MPKWLKTETLAWVMEKLLPIPLLLLSVVAIDSDTDVIEPPHWGNVCSNDMSSNDVLSSNSL